MRTKSLSYGPFEVYCFHYVPPQFCVQRLKFETRFKVDSVSLQQNTRIPALTNGIPSEYIRV